MASHAPTGSSSARLTASTGPASARRFRVPAKAPSGASDTTTTPPPPSASKSSARRWTAAAHSPRRIARPK